MERRRSPRVLISLEITYESGVDFICSFLSDIGEGGVFISTPNPLEVNTQLRICFHIPGMSDSLLVLGTVVWVRTLDESYKPGMGIRFDEMEPADRKRLDHFLAGYKEG